MYEQVISERVDNHGIVAETAEKLAQLYRANAVEADLSGVHVAIWVLAEIDVSRVSAREKAQPRAGLRIKLARVVSALPPAVATTEFDDSHGKPEALDTTCRYCSQPIAGAAWKFRHYLKNTALKRGTRIG